MPISKPPEQPQLSNRPFIVRVFISPDEVRLRSGWRLILQVILLLSSMMFISLIAGIFQFFVKSSFLDEFLFGEIILFLAVTLSVFAARLILDRRTIISLGLKINTQAFWDLFIGMGISGLMIGLIYFLEYFFGWLNFEGFIWQFQPPQTIFKETILVLLSFILVGWYEELFSRGYQLQNIAAGSNMTMGIIVSSIVFALLHLENPHANWTTVVGIFAAGVFLAYGYLRTFRLWLPIGLHIGWNFFEGTIFGFQVSGIEVFRITLQSVEGPEYITGGLFGPEAGLIIVPAYALGVGLIYLYTKDRTERKTLQL
jgi:membrane protease YdiL (CAAX protease family)